MEYDWVHFVSRPLIGLLYQLRMIDLVEWELTGKTEVLGENLLQYHFVHHKSHMTWDRTRAAAVGIRRLTAWAMGRPKFNKTYFRDISSVTKQLNCDNGCENSIYFILIMVRRHIYFASWSDIWALFWETARRSIKNFLKFYKHQNVHYLVHKNPPVVPNLS
jgi:hypothetical protein